MLLEPESAARESTSVAMLAGVGAGYGRSVVLRGLSLELLRGEIYVLLGPNGAGKSTLVRLLTGALKPSAGVVRVEGGRSAVGLAPQESALYPWLTARENVFAFARFEGLPPTLARERAAWALGIARCQGEADTPVGKLSGGYRRRVNIAAALVKQPRLLVLDEPMAGVDLNARRAIAQSIRAVRAQGAAVLLITHDFEEADALADRAGVLIDGRLADEGTPADLVRRTLGPVKRIEIALSALPDATARAVLAQEGAHAIGESWVLFRRLDDWNVQPVVAGLVARGLAVKETRLREPGLESVYSALHALR